MKGKKISLLVKLTRVIFFCLQPQTITYPYIYLTVIMIMTATVIIIIRKKGLINIIMMIIFDSITRPQISCVNWQ